jgi:RNA polymerase sigma factor (sigma-70 family)
MMNTNMTPVTANNDAELVNDTLAGNRDAFGQIVSRYQSLVCSLAYSATGSLGQSEDLAQGTFITAWKHLGRLRERHKLRAWLCGIARNRINNFLRRERREPIREAEPLENIPDSQAPGPMPAEQTISNEEQAILWRSLERIPQLYREPLILFYREHQSVEAVAQSLDLSEDAVKQRLLRGRKLLQEEVLNFVEGALERTNPGKVFTVAVLAALAAVPLSAKAATLGATAAKGSAAAKAAGATGLLGAMATPFLVIFGNYATYRMSRDEALSNEERGHIKALFQRALGLTLLFSAVLAGPLFWACRKQADASLFWSMLITAIMVIYFLMLGALAFASLRARRRYLAGLLAEEYAGNFPPAAYEYRSRLSLFGLPLVHIRLGGRFDVLRGPVKAWIAIATSHAVGVIFASGTIAVAPISFGGIAIGLLPFGAIAAGMLAIGACSLGVWTTGGLVIGWQVFGGCAIAWNAASGGVAVAHDMALGGIARAAQANTDIARQFVQSNLFMQFAQMVSHHPILVALIWILPLSLQGRVVRRARRQQAPINA